jgi:hypothetical protein
MKMKPTSTANLKYAVIGALVAICFALFTGFRMPGPSQTGGSYQFFKEKDHPGVWVFEPDSGVSKYFDVEKGVVIVNSFQMDSITVKSKVKILESKE